MSRVDFAGEFRREPIRNINNNGAPQGARLGHRPGRHFCMGLQYQQCRLGDSPFGNHPA
jgi:hypothetical protein